MSSKELYDKILSMTIDDVKISDELGTPVQTLGYGPKPSGTHKVLSEDGVIKLRVVNNKFFILSEPD